MSHPRLKRLLLGWLALLAPLPLPFNEVLEWPVLLVYALLVVYFLLRADRDNEAWLPNWALNLLGLFYFPVFFFELFRAVQVGFNEFVQAILHLVLFLVVVKLFSLRREKDKWHLLVGIFFVFVASMATSSHLSIAFYLIAFLGLAFWVLARLAQLHLTTAYGDGQAGTPALAAPLLLATLAVLVLAVPLFPLMPRLREPFVLGDGGGAGGLIRTTGFSDTVDLDLTTAIRGNRDAAMRIKYRGDRPRAEDLRLRGAAYDVYSDRRWSRLPSATRPVLARDGRTFELHADDAARRAEIFLEPLNSRSLVLPVETLRFVLESTQVVALDQGGTVLLPGPPPTTVAYTVELAAQPVFRALLSGPGGVPAGLDLSGLTPRMRALAVDVMGTGTAAARAARLERHLQSEYAYTLDFVGRDGQQPLSDFLFVYKSGHCEYFASSMVLLLRSQGIPARLVTGFLGAEYNPLEGYYLVRQENAHAWVEARVEGGWRIYDPTPPDGRPRIAEQSLRLLAGQLADSLIYRWDRYVLTFGADDQAGFFDRWRQRLAAWWDGLRGEEAPAPPPSGPVTTVPMPGAAAPPEVPARTPLPAVLMIAVLLAALAAAVWSRRPPASATAAYRGLRRQLVRAGLEVGDSLAPRAIERLAGHRLPTTAAPARRVVGLYLRESYAGETLTTADRFLLRDALRAIAAAARRARARR